MVDLRTHPLLTDAPPVASMVENIVGSKLMNERWRKLLRYGIVQRRVYGAKPPIEVEYRLTTFGRRFTRILDEVTKLQRTLDASAEPHARATRDPH